MKIKVVSSSWMNQEGRRLDCGPYMTGAIEIKAILENLLMKKEPLNSLTKNDKDGIYKGKQLKRIFVKPPYGIPFLTTSSMLLSDLSNLPLLDSAIAQQDPRCMLKKEDILVSAAGTIGRLLYVRPDMENMFACGDILKIRANSDKIPSGYLYSFLSSKFGIPLLTAGTYGSIIQHLDISHISNLPIPRLNKKLEEEIHNLITLASNLRCNTNIILNKIKEDFNKLISNVTLEQLSPKISIISSSFIQKRLDAAFHDPIVNKIRTIIKQGSHSTIVDFCSTIFLPGIFKRIYTDDSYYGSPYYTGSSLFWIEPISKGILSKKSSLFNDVVLTKGTILIQAFGQDGGLTGRPVWVGSHLHGATTTHMLVRLITRDKLLAGYLFAFLLSEAGYRQISSLTYGGSIPHLDEKGIATVLIPLLPEAEMREISRQVINALDERDRALSLELEARNLVEKTIEEACHG